MHNHFYSVKSIARGEYFASKWHKKVLDERKTCNYTQKLLSDTECIEAVFVNSHEFFNKTE
jgi:hypothetical protein